MHTHTYNLYTYICRYVHMKTCMHSCPHTYGPSTKPFKVENKIMECALFLFSLTECVYAYFKASPRTRRERKSHAQR